MRSTHQKSSLDENNWLPATPLESGLKGAEIGAAAGAIPIVSYLMHPMNHATELGAISHKITSLGIAAALAVVTYVQESLPDYLRPSTNHLIGSYLPSIAAPAVDLAAAGFVAGVTVYGMFALGEKLLGHKAENENTVKPGV